jgi:hypothetical protein
MNMGINMPNKFYAEIMISGACPRIATVARESPFEPVFSFI